MTREQALNYLYSSGFSKEQVQAVVKALEQESTTKNDLGVELIDRVEKESGYREIRFYCSTNVLNVDWNLKNIIIVLTVEVEMR